MGTWQWSRKWSLTPSTKRVSHRGSLLKGVAVHQESPCSDIFRKRATKPLLKQKHRQKTAIYQDILEHFMLSSADKLYLWRCWFNFPAGLGTCPHCQRYQKLVQWPWYYCAWLASKLAWPEPYRESTMQMTWRLPSKQPGLPLHLNSATGWLHPSHWCSISCKRRPNQVFVDEVFGWR